MAELFYSPTLQFDIRTPIYDCVWCAAEELLACATEHDGIVFVTLRGVKTKRIPFTATVHTRLAYISANTLMVADGHHYGTICVWNTLTGKKSGIVGPPCGITAIQALCAGSANIVAVAYQKTYSQTVVIVYSKWRVTWTEICAIPMRNYDQVSGLAFTDGATKLTVVCSPALCTIYNIVGNHPGTIASTINLCTQDFLPALVQHTQSLWFTSAGWGHTRECPEIWDWQHDKWILSCANIGTSMPTHLVPIPDVGLLTVSRGSVLTTLVSKDLFAMETMSKSRLAWMYTLARKCTHLHP